MTETPKFVILGAGGRGQMFSDWLANEYGPGCVIAVAEPNPVRRAVVAEAHGIPAEMCFETWQDLLAKPRLAEILINTTLDKDHIGSAVQAMQAGYHMLLEKPMAVTLEDCQTIDRVRQETGRIVSVCHSLRYHAVFAQVRDIIRSGILGNVVCYDQLEAIEHIHMSHSFVRGNWQREDTSTFLLMAKSCHDVDILCDMVGDQVRNVNSYGNLSYFRPENAPAGAPDFCIQGCPVSESCPYDATKIYLHEGGWAHHAGFDRMPRQQAMDALRVSNYGRCAFKANNNVVDHQVVSLEFENGATATLTVTAFTPFGGRFIRVHGTKGYLEAKTDERTIDYWEFWNNNQKTSITVPEVSGGHGGADSVVMRTFIDAVLTNNPSKICTDTATSLATHTVVFRAEESRRSGRAVKMTDPVGSSLPI